MAKSKITPEALRMKAKMLRAKETDIPKAKKAVEEAKSKLDSARAMAKVTKSKADKAKVLDLQADYIDAKGKLAAIKAGRG